MAAAEAWALCRGGAGLQADGASTGCPAVGEFARARLCLCTRARGGAVGGFAAAATASPLPSPSSTPRAAPSGERILSPVWSSLQGNGGGLAAFPHASRLRRAWLGSPPSPTPNRPGGRFLSPSGQSPGLLLLLHASLPASPHPVSRSSVHTSLLSRPRRPVLLNPE